MKSEKCIVYCSEGKLSRHEIYVKRNELKRILTGKDFILKVLDNQEKYRIRKCCLPLFSK